MTTHSPFKSAYLRFLEMVSAIESLPGMEDLDANERALFDTLCLGWSQGKPMTVREAINQGHLGSPATLHKRLHRLIDRHLINAEHEGNDRRAKYLKPSEQGLAYIGQLDAQLAIIRAVEVS